MDLHALFSPKSIAVIGASTKPESVGYTLTENLLKNGYAGKTYPINPKTDTLFGLPCYKNITEVPQEIDLAVIIVPAAIVPQVLREAGEKNVRAAIIISSGFKETGSSGQKLEDEIASIAREYGIALLGPNCLGFIHPKIGLNASFASRMPEDGSIAFFSQSGALCTAILDLTAESLGFSCFASIGNKAVIEEDELLRHFAQDEDTRIISFYTEGLTESDGIIKAGRAILARSQAKPIIALKSGVSEAGTRASNSHTGALAGSDAAYQALFRQARIIRAKSLEQLVHFLAVFSHNPLPQGQGNRLAIITNAGGLGVLATDAAMASGLEIASLSEATKEKLKAVLPAAASIQNPVDVLGDALADRYRAALEIVAADDQADMLLVIVTPQTMTQARETAQAIADIKKHSGKPVVAVFAGKESFEAGIALLRKNGIAMIAYPEAGAQALGALAQVSKWRDDLSATQFSFKDIDREKAAAIIGAAKQEGRAALTEMEASGILAAYGFPFLETHMAKSKEEALEAARSIGKPRRSRNDSGKPVALKIVSPDIIHKSDAHGVLLDISPDNAGDAYEKLLAQVSERVPEARLEGALVVEMAQSDPPKIGEARGKEIILGLKKEPRLGTVVLAGLGGIFTEAFKDSSLRFAPLTEEDAREMLSELKSLPLLEGARGERGIDIPALIGFIGRLSRLASDFPEIAELDINPLLVFPDVQDFRVLDARIRLS